MALSRALALALVISAVEEVFCAADGGGGEKGDALRELYGRLTPEQQRLVDEAVGKSSSPPKKLTIKRATRMMRQLVREMTGRKARRALRERRSGGEGGQESEDAVFQRIAPVVEVYTKHALEEYGFETGPGSDGQWGIQKAVAAAYEAFKSAPRGSSKARILGAAVEDFNGVIMGPGGAEGCLPELDALAEGFVDLTSEEERQAALRSAESTEGGEVYVQTMRSIMQKGEGSVVKALREAEKEWAHESKPELRSQARARMNVLRVFLRDQFPREEL